MAPAIPVTPARRARAGTGAVVIALVGLWSLLSVGLTALLRPANCVHAEGVAGFVAANLAQMRSVATCPAGTLGYGPHTAAAVSACAALMAALVVAHVSLTAIAVVLARAAAAVRDGLAALRTLPERVQPVRTRPHEEPRAWVARPAPAVLQVRPVWRRGPPVLA
ncbi:hypothetical protein LQF12_02700 [Ruania suaedae]|uniref:hypothetical protein n=1 Tax=Ruania suaedae TaxID=2897774 RepID=UPI001E5C0C22|nr:hypothetical protein [Ruania suaedae]UFU03538.1 hypothetical protein LQF12_02700 [Ruania suaedae]